MRSNNIEISRTILMAIYITNTHTHSHVYTRICRTRANTQTAAHTIRVNEKGEREEEKKEIGNLFRGRFAHHAAPRNIPKKHIFLAFK